MQLAYAVDPEVPARFFGMVFFSLVYSPIWVPPLLPAGKVWHLFTAWQWHPLAAIIGGLLTFLILSLAVIAFLGVLSRKAMISMLAVYYAVLVSVDVWIKTAHDGVWTAFAALVGSGVGILLARPLKTRVDEAFDDIFAFRNTAPAKLA